MFFQALLLSAALETGFLSGGAGGSAGGGMMEFILGFTTSIIAYIAMILLKRISRKRKLYSFEPDTVCDAQSPKSATQAPLPVSGATQAEVDND